MQSHNTTLLLTGALLFAANAAAQTPVYVTSPKGFLTTEGATDHDYMLFSKWEMQWQAVDRSHVGSGPIVMNSVAWRRDAVTTAGTYVARTLTNFEMLLSDADYNNLDKDDLTKNYKTTPVQVIAPKNFVTADWSAASASTPDVWTNSIKFDRPFVYLGKDALLWEVRYTQNTSTTTYPFDFQYVGSSTANSNTGVTVGTSCTTSGKTSPISFSCTFYNHGDKFRIYRSVSNMPANAAVFINMDYLNQNLTIPGICTTVHALPWILWYGGNPTSSSGSGTHYFDNIPHVKGLQGAKFWFQAWAVDFGQAGAPFAMSYAKEITVPADPVPTMVTRHYHYKSTSTSTTTTKSGPWYGGIITRFGSQ